MDIYATKHECPECGGEGVAEYERAVRDFDHRGYLEAYLDECEKCRGDGEIEIEMSFLEWCKYERENGAYCPNPTKPSLKDWFTANKQSLLTDWQSEMGIV